MARGAPHPDGPIPCPVCSELFTPYRLRPDRWTRTCSRACGDVLRYGVGVRRSGRICVTCGATFTAVNTEQRNCSRECYLRSRPGRSQPPRVACSICAKERQPGDRWRSHCSTQCRIDASGYRVKDLYGAALSMGLRGSGWLGMLREYLRERDGDRCGICRGRIDFSLPSGPRGDPSGLGPSVDHIEPRSKGGSDDPANLRLAHWRCNRERKAGRKGEAVQLALVG